MIARKYYTFILTLILTLSPGLAAFSDYPEIKQLNYQDILFKQIQTDIQSYFKASSRAPKDEDAKENLPRLRILIYHNQKRMDLFSLAARLNLPYDTIASINCLKNPASFINLDRILIPNLPGIFVPLNPETAFEEILFSISTNSRYDAQRFIIKDQKSSRPFLFFLGDNFHTIERAYFLSILFRFPLPTGKLTSSFGIRSNPFTGHPEFHHGLDISAPMGTEVFAARDGIVEEVDYDPVLGNYVKLLHDGGYQTVYGHLNVVKVSLKKKVTCGMVIGEVGSTGYATGAHLHFEIRRKGHAKDPVPLLPIKRE